MDVDKIEILEKIGNHFYIEILDVSQVLTAKYKPVSKKKQITSSKYFITSVKNIHELRKTLSERKDVICISGFMPAWQDWFIYRCLNKEKITLISISQASYVANSKYLYHTSLRKQITNIFLKNKSYLINIIAYRMYLALTKVGFFKKNDIFFVASKNDLMVGLRNSTVSDFELINSSIYDSLITRNPILSDDFIVFLAQNFPYENYDIVREGGSQIDRSSYAKEIDNLLNQIENKFGKKTVICVHPKYNIENKTKDFGIDRIVVQYQTELYIEKAFCVIGHFSSALNYGIAINKPIIFVTSALFLKNKWIVDNINFYINETGISAINMSEDNINFEIKKIPEWKRNMFIRRHLSSLHPCKQLSAEIIINRIAAEFNKIKGF